MTRTAIIGAGIAGWGVAYALRDQDFTIHEALPRAGGHANTARVGNTPVDTGFIVYNEPNYPNLVALFAALGVETMASDMSFAASLGDGALEYSGHDLAGLFAQKRNLLRPRFWAMLRDVGRFHRLGRDLLAQPVDPDLTMAAFLDRHRFSHAFLHDHLIPMAAAIWSAPPATALEYPAHSFCQFFSNHGLLSLTDRPNWRTVAGGSERYVQAMVRLVGDRLQIAAPVARVERDGAGVLVTARGETKRFDRVVFACHLDVARALLADADGAEAAALGGFQTQPNEAWLHSDPALMPKRRKVWSSWNYLQAGSGPVTVSYWMNRLQGLDPTRDVFVTLNPAVPPRADLTHGRYSYRHPQFDIACLRGQGLIERLQGHRSAWYAGAQLGHGFHEDGLVSGLRVGLALGGGVPWHSGLTPAGGVGGARVAAL